MTRLRTAFIGGSVLWAALLVAVPFLASRAHASAIASAVIVGAYGIGSLVCHQLPERSYHLWTAQMPVCARCAGIYFGGAVGGMAAAVRTAAAATRGLSPARASTAAAFALGSARVALALAAAPTLVTLVYEWTTGNMPSHAVRAAAGLPLGFVVAWLVVAAAENQVN